MDVLQPSGIPLGMIAEKVGAKLKGDPEILIQGVSGLENASHGDLSFVTSAKYKQIGRAHV